MQSESAPIICCGFTPCVQRILEFAHVETGSVNRALRVTIGIGGKGANTARMVRQLGGNPVLVAFAGGANGRLLEQLLDAEGVDYRHVKVEGETRICQTLVEEGNPQPTELVEEMPPLSADEWNRMEDLIRSLDLSKAIVPISGKLPAGVPVDGCARITRLVAEQGGRVILDTPGEALLAALAYKPFMVKINEVELLQSMAHNDLRKGCRELLKMGTQSVLITRGSRGAFYMDDLESVELCPPEIEAVNPVGSGDAVTAGLAVDLSRGKGASEAMITGMACGAANALNLISGRLYPGDVERLRPLVQIKSASERG